MITQIMSPTQVECNSVVHCMALFLEVTVVLQYTHTYPHTYSYTVFNIFPVIYKTIQLTLYKKIHHITLSVLLHIQAVLRHVTNFSCFPYKDIAHIFPIMYIRREWNLFVTCAIIPCLLIVLQGMNLIYKLKVQGV